VKVETVQLADRFETGDTGNVVHNLGPTVRGADRYPAVIRFVVVYVLTVPWADAGEAFRILLSVVMADGHPLRTPDGALIERLAILEAAAERNAFTLVGAELTQAFGYPLALPIPAPGTYRVVVEAEGGGRAEREFHCIQVPGMGLPA
jgi:hypothetical protein